jgi:hypothetical protein
MPMLETPVPAPAITPAPTPEATPEPTPRPRATPAVERPRPETTGERPAPRAGRSNADRVETMLAAPSSAETRTEIRRYLEANVDSPDAARLLIRIGRISLDLSDPIEAQKAFATARQIGKDDTIRNDGLIGLAETAIADGRIEESLLLWKQLAEQSADASRTPEALAGRAAAMAASGDLSNADAAWRALETRAQDLPATEADPWVRRELLGRGLTAELSGKDEDARGYYKQLIGRGAETPEARTARQRLADMDKALAPAARAGDAP